MFTYDGTNWVANMPYNTNTDTKVNVTLGKTTKAYILGTTSTPTNTAAAVTTIADTGVYLGATAGTLYATTFYGNLAGNATSANTATNLETAPVIQDSNSNNVTNLAANTTYTLIVGNKSVAFKTPVDNNVDTKVSQTAYSDNKEYKILTTNTNSPSSGTAYGAGYAAGVTLNPSTSTITATTFKGNATTATNILAYSKTFSATSGSTAAYGWIRIATGPLSDTFGTFTINSSANGYHTMVKFTAGYCCYSSSYKQYDLS